MTSFLDKLAMEVDVWSAAGFHKAGMQGEDYLVLASESWEENWLQRRKELINEPGDADSVEGKVTRLAQRKIQSVLDSGEYRKMKDATVLVNEHGHTAIVSKGGAFYWVDNEALMREWSLAGEGDEIN